MANQTAKLLKEKLVELNYVSETDAPFSFDENRTVRVKSFSKFFKPLIRREKRQSAEEREQANRFRDLKGFIMANSTHRAVYLIGDVDIEVRIYASNSLSGKVFLITTKAVQT